jgi:hypothetical protein
METYRLKANRQIMSLLQTMNSQSFLHLMMNLHLMASSLLSQSFRKMTMAEENHHQTESHRPMENCHLTVI